jgi:hypothetical protein
VSALIPRQTVEQIVDARNQTLILYADAFKAIAAADAAVKAAHAMSRRAAPRSVNNISYERAPEVQAFYGAVKLPDPAQYERTARRILDIECWAHIVEMTDLERLMDREAKEQLRAQMRYVPERTDRNGQLITEDEAAKGMPPITVENIFATLERFRQDAGLIFRRGIANVFSALDRRFRSHDGFKVGSRIIVTRMFSESGRLEWGRTRDTLIDVERVFSILDGHPEASFQSTLHMLERERGGSWGARQSEHENEYFRVRCFKNGNAHLWFRRDDLVEKVNKLLAEHYGAAVGDGQAQEEDPLENRKTTIAKRFGFFPTPDEAAEHLFNPNGWRKGVIRFAKKDSPRLRFLEPSAGTGNLARRCIARPSHLDSWSGGRARYEAEYRFDNIVDCVEIQPELAARLRADGIYNRIMCADFLTLRPQDFEPYDTIVMNPPFDRERDIDHVTHALKFLRPGGSLHAIMSAGTEFRETKKSQAFRDLVAKLGGSIDDLPAGSFSESGTWCNTIIVRVTS